MMTIDATHDKNATSWVESAQGSDFPIQNLPWSVCSTYGIVVAIGDKAVVIRQAITSGKLQLAEDVSKAFEDICTCNRRLVYIGHLHRP